MSEQYTSAIEALQAMTDDELSREIVKNLILIRALLDDIFAQIVELHGSVKTLSEKD